MIKQHGDIIISGHICLDIIPKILVEKDSLSDYFQPGKLLHVGPVMTSTGGVVANTGIALKKMGYDVRLMGKIGADDFGKVLLSSLEAIDPSLTQSMIIDESSNTSYTVVISPPGIDRVFLHCPGANDTFGPENLTDVDFSGASIFHFGYPPLMKRMFADGGVELEAVLKTASSLVTSMDMAAVDPDSESGQVDWQFLLKRVMPCTDIFLPSYDEICCMLDKEVSSSPLEKAPEIAQWLLDAGVGVVVMKLGADGLYLKTSDDVRRLAKLSERCGCDLEEWVGRELWVPCFQVEVVGTTGTGDTTIAGFLAALVEGSSPGKAIEFATAVGACACESANATSGIRTREGTSNRIKTGWDKLANSAIVPGWKWDSARRLALGPRDQQYNQH